MKKTEAKNIAIVDPVGRKAGMDLYDVNLARALVAKGIKTSIFSNFEVVGFNTHTSFKLRANGVMAKAINLIKGHFNAFRRARANHCTHVILHAFSFEAKELIMLCLARGFRLKILLIVHDVSGFASKDNRLIKNLILSRLASTIIVHNSFSRHVLLEDSGRDIQNKTHVIPHGNFIPNLMHKWKASEAREQLGLDLNSFYLLFFGQIKRVKGLDILIDAMAGELPCDIRVIIAGRPWEDNFDSYSAQIRKLGLEDRFDLRIRFIENRERDLLFSAADLLVLPYREIYQSGVALLAMSNRVPVLASDLDPFLEITGKGAFGLIFKSEDPNALREQIVFAHNHAELLGHQAEKAFEHVALRYDWDRIADLYHECIKV